jgi:sugar/nucleoside kinase (ribokinase family)
MYKTGRDEKYETFYPTDPVEVVDVCGAGDTFLAAVVYQYLNAKDIGTAIKFANQCAAITVQHRGVYSLTKSDLDSIII